MAKRKNMMDKTPVCERCGKVAPNWTVYRTKEPCECGGKYTARAFLDDRVRSSCDKETNHADEYISREAALTALQDSDLFNTTERQLRAIRELPAADVAEVVHGRWIWNEEGEIDWEQFYRCSNCGDKEYWESNFCPNCGAKMDLEE